MNKAVTVSAVMGKIASVVGYVAGVLSLVTIFLGLTDLESDGAADAVIIFLIILALCIFLIYKGIQIKKRINRFRQYDSIILADKTSIAHIAARTSLPVDFVRTDLRKMIKKNYFSGAIIDTSTDELVFRGKSPKCEPLPESRAVDDVTNISIIEYKVTMEDYINAVKFDLKKPILLVGVLAYLSFYLIFFIFAVLILLLYLLNAPSQMVALSIISFMIAVVILVILSIRRSRAARIVKGRLKRGELDPQYFGLHRLELTEDGIEHQYGNICTKRAYAGIQKTVDYTDGIMVYNSQTDRDIVPSAAFLDVRQRGAFLNCLQAKISQAKSVGVSNRSEEEHNQDTPYVLEYAWDETGFITAMIRASRMMYKTRLGWPPGQIALTLIGFLLFLAGIPSLIRLFTDTIALHNQLITLLPGMLCFGFGVSFLAPLIVTYTPLAENTYRRQINSGSIPGDYFGPQSLFFKEDRITERRSMSSYDVLYDTVYGVRYDENCMYIFLKGRRVFVIPNSAFHSDSRKQEIINYIKSKNILRKV